MVERAVSRYKLFWDEAAILSSIRDKQSQMTVTARSSLFSATKPCRNIAVILMQKWGIFW